MTTETTAKIDVNQIRTFMGEVRGEMRKVVWPSRKETTTTTLVVFAMVIAVSLFLWLVDTILNLIITSIVG